MVRFPNKGSLSLIEVLRDRGIRHLRFAFKWLGAGRKMSRDQARTGSAFTCWWLKLGNGVSGMGVCDTAHNAKKGTDRSHATAVPRNRSTGNKLLMQSEFYIYVKKLITSNRTRLYQSLKQSIITTTLNVRNEFPTSQWQKCIRSTSLLQIH